MNEHCWQLDDYRMNEEVLSKEGFTLSVAKRCLPIAILFAWDAYHLFCYAKELLDKGTYLEIGGGFGGSVVCAYLATQASGSSVDFITIDSFVPSNGENWSKNDFLANTSWIPCLRLMECASDRAKDEVDDGSIDLLFVDGSHRYEQVRRDLENYWPKVKTGGVLLGHDYNTVHPGVMQAADEVFGKEKLTLLKNSSMWMVKK